MKAGNVFLIILSSIITVIGLLCTKLYEKYVKKNVLVQWALYTFWTLIVLRVLAWAFTPLMTTGTKAILVKCGEAIKYVFDSIVGVAGDNGGILVAAIIFSSALIISVLTLRYYALKIYKGE